MEWSREQIEQWRLRWRAYLADAAAVTLHQEIDQQRRVVQHEMSQLLHAFLDGALTVRAFSTAFQQTNQQTQNVFNLRGMSGGMFFNKLVKYIPEEEVLARRLRAALVVPRETRDGQRRMLSFTRFLEGFIAQQKVAREHLQPARVPFFLSAWWHLQESQHWPIFYPLAQTVLTGTALRLSPQEMIEAYLVFRTQFLALAKALGLSSWELEHVLTWYGQQQVSECMRVEKGSHARSRKRSVLLAPQGSPSIISTARETSSPIEYRREEEELPPKQERDTHTHLQWLLAKLGHKVGCAVWVASNDHHRSWNNERLGDLSLPSLPAFIHSAYHNIIRRIDVLWLSQETIVAAYEIEHTTDIATGLLRLYDLGALCSQADYLCVVAPQDRFRRIQFELSRPSFARHEMHARCRLISEELLLEQEEHMLRWAGSLSVIENLLHPFDGSVC